MQTGAYSKKLTAAAGTTGGGVLSLPNPLGADLIVTDLILDVKTPGPAATTVDAGIAANGTTSSDTLIDGGAVSASAVLNNHANKGTNGKDIIRWGATQYLTVTASGALTGLVGDAHVKYIRATSDTGL